MRRTRAALRDSRALYDMAVADYEKEVEEVRAAAREAAALAREDEIASATGTLRLWRVTNLGRSNYDYETYSDFVVAAVTAEQARRVHPGIKYTFWDKASQRFVNRYDGQPSEVKDYGSWTDDIDSLEVVEIGTAVEGMKPGTVLCTSFHAG
jgi:hypothetical protein